jgi:hypothetical protein
MQVFHTAKLSGQKVSVTFMSGVSGEECSKRVRLFKTCFEILLLYTSSGSPVWVSVTSGNWRSAELDFWKMGVLL